VIAKYGADAVRYWSAGATLGSDLRYNERDVANGKRLMTKLWNATKFVATHLFDEEGEPVELPAGRPTMIDRWIVSRLQQVTAEATKYLDRYEYSHALDAVERFFFAEFCDNYIEVVKERFWTPEKFDPAVVDAGRHTLFTVNRAVVHLFAPFIPFITEELYQRVFLPFGGPVSVHVSEWPASDDGLIDDEALEAGRLLIAVLTGARRWKTERKVNENHPLAFLRITAPEKAAEKLAPLSEDLRSASHADAVEFAEGGAVELALELGKKKIK